MSKAVQATGQCLGIDFHLDQFWRFSVPDMNKTFPDYQAMEAAIERDGKKVEAAKKRKVNIAGITESGKKVLVTGIHSGHGQLLVTPKTDDYAVYVDTPLVGYALKELSRLDEQRAAVDGLLDVHKLTGKRYYGRGFDHEAEINRLEEVVAEAKKLASLSLKDGLAATQPREKLEL